MAEKVMRKCSLLTRLGNGCPLVRVAEVVLDLLQQLLLIAENIALPADFKMLLQLRLVITEHESARGGDFEVAHV